MKSKNKFILKALILLMYIFFNSCSSDSESKSNPESNYSNLIIGKWAWSTVEGSCPSYREFKTNNILTYVQYIGDCTPNIDNLSYELVGDKIIFEDADENETIIKINQQSMTITFIDKYLGLQTRTYTKIQ